MHFVVGRRSCLRSFLRILLTMIVFSAAGSFFLLISTEMRYNPNFKPTIDPALVDSNIPENCQCIDNETSIAFNFCYHLKPPHTIPDTGRRFSCDHLQVIKKLGLLDLRADDYFRFNHRPIPSNPPFVTAASDSHFGQALVFITTVHKFFVDSPNQKVIFYDLGLSKASVERVKQLCNVEYRHFSFEAYPSWVKSLMEYRWKPLVIAEALKDYGAIWYMDSSVQLEKGNLSHIYSLLNCRSRPGYNFDAITVGPPLFDANFVESGFHIDYWTESIRRCDKFGYMLQGWAGHGIFSATHPDVYKYIPTDQKRLKRNTCKMYEAGHVLVVRTLEVVRDVLKWYVLCALEKDCMGPPGAGLGCGFGADRFGIYAGCHRFDQSIVNLLLANRNYYDYYYWSSGIVDYFHIVRGGGLYLKDDRAQLRYNCTSKSGV